jgi:hypothetical protein
MCNCNNECSNRSIAYKHTGGAATVTGTPVEVPMDNGLGNIYTQLTVLNETDQDLKVTYRTVQGYAGEFYVSRSIRGFTRTVTDKFDLTQIKVESAGESDAAGIVYFNFAS